MAILVLRGHTVSPSIGRIIVSFFVYVTYATLSTSLSFENLPIRCYSFFTLPFNDSFTKIKFKGNSVVNISGGIINSFTPM